MGVYTRATQRVASQSSIGIDIGTTGAKTLLINKQGTVLASAGVEYPLSHPRPGWAEQDPEDWWRAVVDGIRKVLHDSGIRAGEVRGLGLSGQMHGTVFLDAKNEVLRPAILWCDQRTAAECDEITETIGPKDLIRHTCNPALTGFSAPKIVWLRRHEPDVYAKVRKVLLPKDYIRFRLSGEFFGEVSDASGTLLFDVANRRWSDHVLDKLEIPKAWLPEIFESPEPTTNINATAAQATGLGEGTPIVGGSGDQAAGGVGNGIVREGVVSSTIGTSGVVFASAASPKLDERGRVHTFCHAVPGTWHVMGVMLSAGGSFRWLRDTLGTEGYDELTADAAKAPVGCEGLIFLPYLSGERTPHADPFARGVFFGLGARHDKPALARAVMEGVTYGLRDSLEIIRGMGVEVQQIRASGGGAKSALWRQMQADVFGSPVVTTDKDEGPAFGVALLAAVGTGAYASVEEACDATIRVVSEVEPNPANSAVYNEYYPIYRQLYLDLKARFEQTARTVEKGINSSHV